ncbi:Uncharacterised protein [Mycobacteroides abscessus subsp. abscessus]|nr:Uncharacterised protein [Mycobacteroides abscessus subsp. abscessus]
MRIRARTASTRATSSSSVCPGSATLTFAVWAPGNRDSTSGTSAAVTAGTVALTGMRSRRGVGSARYAASMAADSHAEASAG